MSPSSAASAAPSLTLAEARARAALVRVVSYDVHLDVTDPASFASRTTIRFTCAEPGSATFAELSGAREVTATLNGRPVEYAGGRVHLTDLAAENTLVVEGRRDYVTDGDGLHTFTDPADGERYVSAYCGMDIASKVFCCFDQVDLKAAIRLSVEAPPEWTVLGNGREVRRWGGHVEFARTPRIPTSLFVMCAGPWASVRFIHADRPMGWHAAASRRAALERDAEELRRITIDCFDHYTSTFTSPYPFDGYDQIFVPGLNWGAMEQPGCVLFRDEYLTPGTPTTAERMWRASVVAHEMAHMWFGDLATMRWWEDSWLNESFADYMGYEVAGSAAGYDGMWTTFALARKPAAYVADARRSTHPIAADAEDVVDVDTAFGNFDMITYAKGAAVLRQLVTWLGERDFTVGVDRYLVRHAFGNADLADFLDALASATDRDVRGWAEAWLRTTGFDTIRVDRDGDVPVLHRDGSRPHRLSVGAYDAGGVLVGTRLVDLDDAPVRLEEYAGAAVVPNHGDETYARVLLDPLSRAFVTDRLGTIADPLTRAMLWSASVEEVRAGTLSAADLLGLAARHLPGERDPMIAESVLGMLEGTLLASWTAPEELASSEDTVADIARALSVTEDPSVALAAARTLAGVHRDAAELAGWLAPGARVGEVEVDQDLRWRVVRRLQELGGDPALVEQELARDTSATGVLAALTARAARPDPAAKQAAWELMFAEDVANRDFTALAAGFWSRGQAEPVTPYLARFVAETPDLARRRGQAFAKTIGWGFPRLPLPAEVLRDFRDRLAAALAPDRDVPTVLRRTLADRVDDLDVALRIRGIV